MSDGPFVIQVYCYADGTESPYDGQYLQQWDVDAAGGRGIVTMTTNPNEAHHFKSMVQAHAAWTRTSKVQPKRPDGKPNRPLTAYTVWFLPLSDVTPN